MLGGREKKKSSSPGKMRSNAASDSARNRKGGIKDRKIKAWKAGREKACRNAGMNVNVRACVKEREVKESVRIELVKALRQARFILTGEI
jgi:ABC-type uncharacterized transport system ATPase subunit